MTREVLSFCMQAPCRFRAALPGLWLELRLRHDNQLANSFGLRLSTLSLLTCAHFWSSAMPLFGLGEIVKLPAYASRGALHALVARENHLDEAGGVVIATVAFIVRWPPFRRQADHR